MRRLTVVLLASLVACSDSGGPEVGPARVVAVSPVTQAARVATSLPAPITIQVSDATTRPLPGVAVTWRVIDGEGAVAPAEPATTADGRARAQWTLGPKAGVQRIGVKVGALNELVFEADATAAAPSTVIPMAPVSRSGIVGTSLPDSLRIRLEDAYGNPTPGIQIQWQVAAGGGTLSSNSTTTSAGGESAVAWKLGDTRGVQSVVARAAENIAATFTASGSGRALTRVSGDAQSDTVQGVLTQPLVVMVTDDDGEPVADAEVAWAVAAGDGELNPIAPRTDARGVATAQWRLGTRTGTQTARAVVAGAEALTFDATVLPGRAARIAIEPASIRLDRAGDTVTVMVGAADRFGNALAPNTPGQWTIEHDGPVALTSAGTHNSSSAFRVTALATGTGRIRVAVGGMRDSAAILVKKLVAEIAMDAAPRDGLVASDLPARSVIAKDEHGNVVADQRVIWSSSNPSVARVDSTGAIRALTGGTAVITATVRGESASYSVDVHAFTHVGVGGLHSCALTSEGVVFCWGVNTGGQLGIGADVSTCGGLQGQALGCSPHPVRVAANLRFSKLAVGLYYTCAITTTGDVYCWGQNGAGQLGATSTDKCEIAPGFKASCGRSPVKVAVSRPVVDLSAGYSQTCALHGDGSAACWGSDAANRPISGIVNAPEPFTKISVGSSFTVCALGASGKAYCWGNIWERLQENGWHLAYGVTAPQLVSHETFTDITTGGMSVCGRRSDGSIRCWGGNGSGEFGNGTDTGSKTPVDGAGGKSFATIQTGSFHACGITTSGEAFCWGRNAFGGLGANSAADQCAADLNGNRSTCSFTPLAVLGGFRFRSIDPRSGGHTCALRTDGVVLCWGNASSGQLGRGLAYAVTLPAPVTFAGHTSSSSTVAGRAMPSLSTELRVVGDRYFSATVERE